MQNGRIRIDQKSHEVGSNNNSMENIDELQRQRNNQRKEFVQGRTNESRRFRQNSRMNKYVTPPLTNHFSGFHFSEHDAAWLDLTDNEVSEV